MERVNFGVVDTAGNVVTSYRVRVFVAGTGQTDLVDELFSDDGVTPLSNPFNVTSETGLSYFYAANGRVDYIVDQGPVGMDDQLVEDVLLYDPADDVIDTSGGASGDFLVHNGTNFVPMTPTEAGLDDRYSRVDAKTDGWAWWRAEVEGTDAAVEITQQGTGRLLNLRAGVGDGSVVAYFDVSGNLILPADPSSAMMAATKQYVDLLAAGMDPKGSCRVATTANITLSGEQTIDGVSVVAGNRVLVKNQSSGAENGIYVCAAGAWSRATDANSSAEVTSGLFCFVTEGTAAGDTGWLLTTNDPITLDTTALSFTQFSTVGAYTDENAQDAVGGILTDSSEIDFTYNDGAPSITASLIANSVGVGKLTSTAGSRLFGRATGSAGAGEEITLAADHEFSGGALRLVAFTGDVTKAAAGTSTTIAARAVTFAKFQAINTARLLGRTTASSGDVEELTVDSTLTLAAGVLSISSANNVLGKHTAFIPAAAMLRRTSNPPAALTTLEASSNKLNRQVLDFDHTAIEYAQFFVGMPKGWNAGTVTLKFGWECTATGNVVWGGQILALSDDDVIDTAYGTEQTVTDGVTATTDLMISAETNAITAGNSPAKNDLLHFQIYRKATDANDTVNAADARLWGVWLIYTIDAARDD